MKGQLGQSYIRLSVDSKVCHIINIYYLNIESKYCKEGTISRGGESSGIVINKMGRPSLSCPPGSTTVRPCKHDTSYLNSITWN